MKNHRKEKKNIPKGERVCVCMSVKEQRVLTPRNREKCIRKENMG